jgi:hypothetical protein
MAKIVMEEFTEYPVLPKDSIIHVKVDSTQVVDVPSKTGGTWQKLRFTFKILGVQTAGDGGPVERYESLIGEKIYGDCPFRFNDSPQNKLNQWASAILNTELAVGFELDTDYFDNRQCRAITSLYDKKVKDPSTGIPYKGHQIEALLPIGEPMKLAAAPDPTPVQDPWAEVQAQPVGTNGWAVDDDPPPF